MVAVGVFGHSAINFVDVALTSADFPVGALKKQNLSLARIKYTTAEAFRRYVVEPKGVAQEHAYACACVVNELRSLPFQVEGLFPPRSGRACCVTDLVEPGDHDGHAALGFAEMPGLTPKQIAKVRVGIVKDLVRIFGRTRVIEDVFGNGTIARM